MPASTRNENSAGEPKTRPPKRFAAAGSLTRNRGFLGLLIAVLALAAAGYAIWGQITATTDKQAAQQQAQGIADPVAALCASDPTIYAKLSADSRARWDAACSRAAEVKQSPPPAVEPTDTQIADAVDTWLRAHPPAPGQSATPAMVATAVADWLTTHPPQPGRAPTPDEITAAASTYIAAHATQFQGQPGQPGQNGRDATDAQVSAAVATYCTAHNSCAGPPGTPGTNGAQGPQGVSVTDVQFQRDAQGTCQAIVTLADPATGKTTQATHPAGDAACPLLKTRTKTGG